MTAADFQNRDKPMHSYNMMENLSQERDSVLQRTGGCSQVLWANLVKPTYVGQREGSELSFYTCVHEHNPPVTPESERIITILSVRHTAKLPLLYFGLSVAHMFGD